MSKQMIRQKQGKTLRMGMNYKILKYVSQFITVFELLRIELKLVIHH